MDENSEKLCVVMPVYNEEAAIGGVLEKWVGALDRMGLDYVIRPYNDGSKDGSLAVMRTAAERFPTVEVRDKANGGHGHTILTGYREAAADGFDWVFQVDSDDEMGPKKFEELWRNRGENDFLVGIRDGRVQQLPRKIISLVSRLCVRLFYGKSIWDVNTPYRLMRVSAFADFYRSIPLTTFAPNVILSGLAAKHGLRMFETRVPQHDRTTGEVSIRKWKLLKAAARSFAQTISYALRTDMPGFWFVAGAVVALAARFAASRLGSNYDFESYGIVADIVCRGGNVYAETSRYNYAPIWFNILGLLKFLFGQHMRVGVILLLSLVDIGIAAILWRNISPLSAFLIFLSPISAYISGYHNQFDNMAILVALLAFVWADSQARRKVDSLWPSILMGVSLMVKHVFVFFPFWFLFKKEYPLRRRMVKCAIPLVMFLLSFAPYVLPDAVRDAQALRVKICEERRNESVQEVVRRYYDTTPSAVKGWVKNVVLYRSNKNGLSHRLGLGSFAFPIFIIGMVLSGILLRRRPCLEQGLCYTAFLMLFTPAIAGQYYVIPVAYCAAHIDVFSLLYNFGFYRVWGFLTFGLAGEFVVLLLALSMLWTVFRCRKECD